MEFPYSESRLYAGGSNIRSLPLSFGLVDRMIYGGPYREKPEEMVGIKVAAEIRDRAAMSVPIRDFGVPLRPDTLLEALRFALDRLAEDMPLYVGCMGGCGRTGLFLALLAKSLGHPDPVMYIREFYNPHAVETSEQEAYVRDFDIGPLRKAVRAAKWKAFWHSARAFFRV